MEKAKIIFVPISFLHDEIVSTLSPPFQGYSVKVKHTENLRSSLPN